MSSLHKINRTLENLSYKVRYLVFYDRLSGFSSDTFGWRPKLLEALGRIANSTSDTPSNHPPIWKYRYRRVTPSFPMTVTSRRSVPGAPLCTCVKSEPVESAGVLPGSPSSLLGQQAGKGGADSCVRHCPTSPSFPDPGTLRPGIKVSSQEMS